MWLTNKIAIQNLLIWAVILTDNIYIFVIKTFLSFLKKNISHFLFSKITKIYQLN
jgi:hypothetical protein